MKINLKQISEWLGYDLHETVSMDSADYSSEQLEEVASKAYFEGQRDAARKWTCGKTLQQALGIIAKEEALLCPKDRKSVLELIQLASYSDKKVS